MNNLLNFLSGKYLIKFANFIFIRRTNINKLRWLIRNLNAHVLIILLIVSCSEKNTDWKEKDDNVKTNKIPPKKQESTEKISPDEKNKKHVFDEEMFLSGNSTEVFFFNPAKRELYKGNDKILLIKYKEDFIFKKAFKTSDGVKITTEIPEKYVTDLGPPAQTENETGIEIWPPDSYAKSISVVSLKEQKYSVFPIIEDPDYRYRLIDSFSDQNGAVYLYYAKLRYSLNITRAQEGNYLSRLKNGKTKTVFMKDVKVLDTALINDGYLFLTLRRGVVYLETLFGKRISMNSGIKANDWEKPVICKKDNVIFIHSLKKCITNQCIATSKIILSEKLTKKSVLSAGSFELKTKVHPHASFIKNVTNGSCDAVVTRSYSNFKYHYSVYRKNPEGIFSFRVHNFSSTEPVNIFSKTTSQITVYRRSTSGLWTNIDLDF